MITNRMIDLAPPPRPLKDGQKYNVFLSYRSVNRPWVINLYDTLCEAGHKVFLDQRVLVPGERLTGSIEDAISASQAGVLIWSHAAADSQWVKDEYVVLRGRDKDEPDFHFVPVKLDDSNLPPFAKSHFYLNFHAYPDGPNGPELLRLLHGIVGQPLSREALAFGEELQGKADDAMASIRAAEDRGSADRLCALFDAGGLAWDVSAALGARCIEALAKLGHPDMAVDRARALVTRFPRALRPRQMLAHSLSRRGNAGDDDEAAEILGKLYVSGARDPETLGLYARTFMDAHKATGQRRHLRRARDLYELGFQLSRDDAYCGINAASKSMMLGSEEDAETGRRLAREVADLLPPEITPDLTYWEAATIAGTALILGETDRAIRLFREAVDRFPSETGSHRSTAEQMGLLADHMDLAPDVRAQLQRAFDATD